MEAITRRKGKRQGKPVNDGFPEELPRVGVHGKAIANCDGRMRGRPAKVKGVKHARKKKVMLQFLTWALRRWGETRPPSICTGVRATSNSLQQLCEAASSSSSSNTNLFSKSEIMLLYGGPSSFPLAEFFG
jgi:hypothetical protein